ncbi:MAG: hypothetical protein COA78_27855 [Blastopirellula sp.]|nr:MAG: hypothetical protein COA78_27855 [Blastopirellula sp.]
MFDWVFLLNYCRYTKNQPKKSEVLKNILIFYHLNNCAVLVRESNHGLQAMKYTVHYAIVMNSSKLIKNWMLTLYLYPAQSNIGA